MTYEQLVRREIERGNEYRKVIAYAIKSANEAGLHGLAGSIVHARNIVDNKIQEMFS